MKKKLNVDLIQSELHGGSAFFPGYKRSGSPTPSSKTLQPDVATQSGAGSNSRPTVQKVVKTIDTPTNRDSDSPFVSEGVPPPVPRTVPRTGPHSDHLVPKVKRPMKQRQPFDIYEDQYARLKQIADSERSFVNGRGMSQMVRSAIDAYLATNISPHKKLVFIF